MDIESVVKVMVPAITSFAVGIAITPLLTHYLYKYKAWKKEPGKIALDGTEAKEFNKLHKEGEGKTPRMGGVVIWGSTIITVLALALLAQVWPSAGTVKLDFLSRDQTWIPFAALIVGAVVGLADDLLSVTTRSQGLSLGRRILIILILSTFIGWWFWEKLEVTAVGIPFMAPLEIGIFIIPFFVFVSLALYASGVIDGIDGLSGGVFASIFTSYMVIAFVQEQINLAAFSAAITGGVLAFLWFNIPPARFYMTETGTMALTLTIAVLAFTTDTLGEGIGIAVLPVIGALLVVTVASNVLQVLSKRLRGKKIFRIAPIHHHFQAIGWPAEKVVMRYWVLSIMFAFLGVVLALVGR